MKKTKILLISTILGFLFSFVPITYAQEVSLGLSVSPQIFEIDVFPGETFRDKIILKNASDVPMPILAKTSDFTALEDSGEMEFDESLQDPALSSRKWFNIISPNFILDARGRQEIDFEIHVPKNAESGGRYSVMLFEPQLPAYYFKAGQPKSIPVIGVLFLISVKSLSLDQDYNGEKVEIVEFEIQNKESEDQIRILADISQAASNIFDADINVFEKTPKKFSLKIKNNDIFHHRLDGRVSIYNLFGKKVGEVELKSLSILPQKTRQFPVNISPEVPDNFKWMPASLAIFLTENTSFGKYRAVLELAEQNSEIKLDKSVSFWAFPWKITLMILFLSIVMFLTRKRVKAAGKILFKRQQTY